MTETIKNSSDGREDSGAGSGSGVLTERKVQVRRPSLYRVLLHNDDYTPMEFVIMVLQQFFNKDHAAATEIMLNVHTKGIGVCGTFPFEIAETKVALVLAAAREHQHPLQCTLEKA